MFSWGILNDASNKLNMCTFGLIQEPDGSVLKNVMMPDESCLSHKFLWKTFICT